MQGLSIIIPAYNEATRLPRTFDLLTQAIDGGTFSAFSLTEILIVDDGSQDETVALSERDRQKNPILHSLVRVIRVHPNQGKGNAIHEGLSQAQGPWCLVADADSATPWNEFLKLSQAASHASVSIGSRDLPESDVRTHQSWIREHMGKTFNLLVRFITGLPFKDTQCGFKLIHRPSALAFLPKLKVKRFAWDVEFLMFAKKFGLKTVEVPVIWEHQDDSHVHPVRDATEMLLRVIQLRLRLWLWQ